MSVTLYGTINSPPCRAVLIGAEALGISLNLKKIDMGKGENLTPEYLKINPLHSIPTLDDNGIIIVDSHAILAYLVSKYGKDDSLYPKDLVKKALVDAKLHFDTGYAHNTLRRAVRAHKANEQIEPLTSNQTQEIHDIYDFMNQFLDGNTWITGDSLTIADFSLYATVTSLGNLIPADNSKYPNLRRWLDNAETVPYFQVNKPGLEGHRTVWIALITRKQT